MQLARAINAVLLSSLFSAGLFAETTVDPKQAVIRISPSGKTAAEELQLHLKAMTGKTVPFVSGSIPQGKFVFDVGAVPPGVDSKTLKPEESRWTLSGNALHFYGQGPIGALNAVYLFLEDELGVRWPEGNKILVKESPRIRIVNNSGAWQPSLNIRDIRGRGLWGRRMRMGSHNPPIYGHAFENWWTRFGKTHPEYIALLQGIRHPIKLGDKASDVSAYKGAIPVFGLCVSNPDVVRQIIADWNGKTQYINLCENDIDGRQACECAACRKLDALRPGETAEFHLADRYLSFAKAVLAEAKKIRPDAKIAMYAYNQSQEPPNRERVTGDIVLGIVPRDFGMPTIGKYVGGWKKTGMEHFFYRPNRHHYYISELPCGFEEHFFNLWQYLYRQGAIGFDYDSPAIVLPPQWFADYVIAKAMQDPEKSFADWEKHYCEAYGAAAPEVMEYFRYWRKNVWEKRLAPKMADLAAAGRYSNFGRGLMWNVGNYFRTSDFDAADRILAKAKGKQFSAGERALFDELVKYNTHARLIFEAASKKTDDAAIALLKFRRANGIAPLNPTEQYWGDVCGIKRVMDFEAYDPPFIQTPLFWRFRLDPKDAGLKEEWFKGNFRQIVSWGAYMGTNMPWEHQHPHYKLISPEIRAAAKNYDGVAWYAVPLEKFPLDWKGSTVYLYFGAVDESCTVWFNGKLAGEHKFVKSNDWATPFVIEITDQIDWTKPTQIAVVRVVDKGGDGGIWKRVWILRKKAK